MRVETRKVVVLDMADCIEVEAALKAALSVKSHEVKSEEEGDAKMDCIIHFLNAIIDNFKQV